MQNRCPAPRCSPRVSVYWRCRLRKPLHRRQIHFWLLNDTCSVSQLFVFLVCVSVTSRLLVQRGSSAALLTGALLQPGLRCSFHLHSRHSGSAPGRAAETRLHQFQMKHQHFLPLHRSTALARSPQSLTTLFWSVCNEESAFVCVLVCMYVWCVCVCLCVVSGVRAYGGRRQSWAVLAGLFLGASVFV